MFSAIDAKHMARAIELAKRGIFTTSPNPNVGCVIVSANGDVLSEGFHQKAGEAHAEAAALASSAESVAGATVYVTLEPCSHYGRTPPCSDALINTGIKRVVVAMQDPNPKVAGRGLKKLRDAGIQVDVGLMEAAAKELNTGFIKRQLQGMPKVTLKMAASLDGKTALSNTQSKWITGAAARRDVQRHRAMSCAIISGSGTVLADDPSLNVRPEELPEHVNTGCTGEIRQPLRVILDGRNQLHSKLKVFADNNVLVINLSPNVELSEADIKQWQAPVQNGKIDLRAVLAHLAQMQLNDIWLEAGSRLAGAFIAAELVDSFILYLAPKLMGHSGFSLVELPAFEKMEQVPELHITETKMVGDDIKIVAHFR
ncbi:riboflavin biosynthesis protein RibD [Planctobacterium marinum]|uniref:Riboflavin biosynthesis protein RibD n=2 Tax=Planctobacterium marinum TaxID=1631968 RepID=A0AA48HJG2_9ALTE|nr:riboflavin biosynthesis protein RibD [Planctobacterium marinum]